MLWLILIIALLVEPCPIGTGVPDAERRLDGDGYAGGDAGDYAGYYVGYVIIAHDTRTITLGYSLEVLRLVVSF